MDWVPDQDGHLCAPQSKRKYQPRRKEFIGWGSVELIEFLESIGKDTSQQISRDVAAAIITGYIKEQKLTDPDKKKTVHCDARLLSLFGKKKLVRFNRMRILDLLSAHYAENKGASDDDSSQCSGDEDVPARSVHSIPQKRTPKAVVPEVSSSPFAAVVPANMKLLYLKRSLVQDLLKDIATFEQKVTGSFVRIKSDPNDFLQRNPFQLLQVSGIRKASEGAESSNEVLLRVPVGDIHVSKLSDDNFTEEECKELREKIKDGVYKRLTRVEVEEKVQVLHEDITKHWLVREIALLQSLIERANEKGWRRELDDYLERKELLQKPDEQSRMLREVPKVIPERLEDESAGIKVASEQIGNDFAEDDFLEDDVLSHGSPVSIHGDSPENIRLSTQSKRAASDVINFSGHKKQRLENSWSNGGLNGRVDLNLGEGFGPTRYKTEAASRMIDFSCKEPEGIHFTAKSNGASNGSSWRANTSDEARPNQAVENRLPNGRPACMDLNKDLEGAALNTFQVKDLSSVALEMNGFSASSNGANASTSVSREANSAEDFRGGVVQEDLHNQRVHMNSSSRSLAGELNRDVQGTSAKKVEAAALVIDLSSDDEDETIKRPNPQRVENRGPGFNLESTVWFYTDPSGNIQGPFSLEMLKMWSDASYFPPGFKVWMNGQSPSQAVLLTDIFRYIFP